MSRLLAVLCIACFFASITGQVTTPGRCPQVTTLPSFDLQRYLGQWFVQERFFFAVADGQRCNSIFYSGNSNGTISLIYTGVRKGIVLASATVARPLDSYPPGRSIIAFPPLPPEEYVTLRTDYKTYAIIYACRNQPHELKTEYAFILTRKRHGYTSALQYHIYSLFVSFGIDPRLFEPVNQAKCPKIPIGYVAVPGVIPLPVHPASVHPFGKVLPVHPIPVHPVPVHPVGKVLPVHPVPIHPAPIHPVGKALPVHPAPFYPFGKVLPVHPAPVHPFGKVLPVHPIPVHPVPVHPVGKVLPVHPAPVFPIGNVFSVHPVPAYPVGKVLPVHPIPVHPVGKVLPGYPVGKVHKPVIVP